MSATLFDAEATALLVPAATMSADTTYPALAGRWDLLATSAWCLSVTAVSGTPAFLLEASDTGPTTGFVQVARFDWSAGIGQRQVAVGVNASVVRGQVNSSRVRWLRVRVVTSASVTFSSWLGKPQGSPGLGTRTLDTVNAI